MSIITGKFDLVTSDNFDAYLKAAGVGFAKRLIAGTMRPTVEIISNSDGSYLINTYSKLKNTTIRFHPGVEFDEETMDGRKAKSTIIIEGNKLIHTQKIGDEQSQTIREFNGDEMTATFTCNGVSSVRTYKKTWNLKWHMPFIVFQNS